MRGCSAASSTIPRFPVSAVVLSPFPAATSDVLASASASPFCALTCAGPAAIRPTSRSPFLQGFAGWGSLASTALVPPAVSTPADLRHPASSTHSPPAAGSASPSSCRSRGALDFARVTAYAVVLAAPAAPIYRSCVARRRRDIFGLTISRVLFASTAFTLSAVSASADWRATASPLVWAAPSTRAAAPHPSPAAGSSSPGSRRPWGALDFARVTAHAVLLPAPAAPCHCACVARL